jgi:glycosyltransferase involved in cell wall biosynthesis
VKIALVSEGTYPFAMGGVSVWCDQLIQGMRDHRWEVVALTVDGRERTRWELPDNVSRVRSIPLWSVTPNADRKAHPDPAFLAAYDELVRAMLTPLAPRSDQAAEDRRRFLDALHGLHDWATRGGQVAGALTTNAALIMLVNRWRDRHGGGLTLADALDVGWLLDHMLRPLFAEPVEADILHASMNGLSMLVAMAAKWRHGTPVVMSEHGIYLRERYLAYLHDDASHAVKVIILNFFRLLAGGGYLIADSVAPHSSYNRRWQLQNGAEPERLWTMYNGVQPDLFPVAATEPAEPTIVFMGRIDPLKDLHTLIRAFQLVHAEIPAARLKIYGGTPEGNEVYRDSCLTLIEELGLSEVARLMGPVASVVDAYHDGTIVALSSISEGFPYTVIEAMACGRTVVCTNVGGVSEGVGAAGRVVPPRDWAAFARECVSLLLDHDLRARLAAAARARVMELFTLQHTIGEYRRLYEHVRRTAAVSPTGVTGRAAATFAPLMASVGEA